MGEQYTVNQIELSCMKHWINLKKHSNKWDRFITDKLTSKFIFKVKILDSFEGSAEEVEAWKAEHPDHIMENVAACIKDCVDHKYEAYLYLIGSSYTSQTSLLTAKGEENGELVYRLIDLQYNMIQLDSEGNVTFEARF